MTEPRVAVVILNTNKREDTLACLRSLAEATWRNLDVIVLDNHSTDGSVEAICARHPGVTLVQLTDNKGYAGNNNVGIELARTRGADWVLVLNEDTIVDPGCIEAMVRYGMEHPGVGVLGPLVMHFDEPTHIQSAGGWFDERWEAGHVGQNDEDRGQYAAPRQVAWVTGCSIMVRRAVIEQIGGIDERFFYYWEETEWCLRARRAGWTIAVVPAARLWHKGVTRHYQPGPNVSYYHTRNKLLLMQSHGASSARVALEILRVCKTLASWSIRPRWRHRHEHRRAVAAGLRDFAMRRWGQRPSSSVLAGAWAGWRQRPQALLLALAIGLSGSVLTATDALAQAGTPEPESQGRLGTFSFNPGVVFSSGYDTNPYRETPAESDVETYIIPQVDGWINLGALRTNVFGAVEIVSFANRVGARNHQLGTRSEWQGARLAPFFQFTSKHTNANPTGFEVGRKSMRNENDLNTGVRAKLSGRLFAQGFFRRTATDWDADAIYQTSSLREKLNRNDTGFGGGVELALTPLTSVRFQAERMTNKFIFSPTRDGSGYRVGPGLTILGPAAIIGNVDVGIRSFKSDLADVEFKGFVSNIALARTFPSDTFVSVRFDRDIQFSYDTSLAYFVGRSTQATVIQPLGELLSVQVFFGRHNLSYSLAVENSPPLNTVTEAGVAVGRRLGSRLRVGVSAEWAKAEGSQPWDEVRVIGFMTFGLGTFQRLDRPVPFQR